MQRRGKFHSGRFSSGRFSGVEDSGALAPVATTIPVVSGQVAVSSVLSVATMPTWDGTEIASGISWQAEGVDLTDETNSSVVCAAPPAASYRIRAWATNAEGGTANVYSNALALALPGVTASDLTIQDDNLVIEVGGWVSGHYDVLTATGPQVVSLEGTTLTMAGTPTKSSVTIAATNAAGQVADTFDVTVEASGYAPVNTTLPVVSGDTTMSGNLTCSTGSWDALPVVASYAYQWKRGATSVGTDSPTYAKSAADAGFTVTCEVVATNSEGSSSPAVSNGIAVVGAPTGDIEFGSLTLTGAGGAPIGESNGTYGQFTVSGGEVVGNTSPLSTGDTVIGGTTVSVVAGYYSAKADRTEIIAATVGGSGTTIVVRDGTETGDRIDLSGQDFSPGGLTIRGESGDQPDNTNRYLESKYANHGVTLPGFDLTGADSITLQDLNLTREREGGEGAGDKYIVNCELSDNTHAINCKFWSKSLALFTPWTDGGMSTLIGFGGLQAGNCTAHNCWFNDLALAFKVNNALGAEFEYNTVYDCSGSFGLQQGIPGDSTTPAGFKWNYNRCIGVWSHGGGLGQTGPNNPGGDPGLYPYDWGDPHGSLHGTGGAHNGFEMIGNIMLAAPHRRRTAYAGTPGEYDGTGSGPKWNDATNGSVAGFVNVTIKHNIFEPTDNVGIQLANMVDSEYAFNTMLTDPDNLPAGLPSVNYQAMSTGNSMHHNVSMGHATASGAPGSIGLHDSFFTNSHENVIAKPAGLIGCAAGDPYEYGELFDGPTFKNLTLGNIVSKFGIKAGGRLDQTVKLGATAYFDFTTNTESAIPAWSKPVTTVATGVDMSKVVFDTGDNARSTPFPTFANTNQLTIMIGLEIDASEDDADINLLQTNNSSIYLRRLPSAYGHDYFRLYCKAPGGGGALSIDTQLTMDSTDGYVVWTFSFDLDNYKCHVMKGTELDPFSKVSYIRDTFESGQAYHNFNDFAGEIGFLYISDEFVDLHSVAQLDKIIALDGRPVAHGADGSSVTGTQPEIYLAGNAAAWNAGGGLNLGSAAQKYIMVSGAVTDAGGGPVTPVLSSPTDAADGETASTGSVATDTANGTLYWVVTGSATPPSAAQVKAGQDHTGSAAADDGSQTVTATGVQATAGSGLTASTQYHTHFMQESTDPLRSNVASASGFTTDAAAGNPELMPDPTFSDASRWGAMPANVTVGGGELSFNGAAVWATPYQAISERTPVTAGVTYVIELDCSRLDVDARIRVHLREFTTGGAQGAFEYAFDLNKVGSVGTFTTTHTASPGTGSLRFGFENITTGADLSFSRISVKEQ